MNKSELLDRICAGMKLEGDPLSVFRAGLEKADELALQLLADNFSERVERERNEFIGRIKSATKVFSDEDLGTMPLVLLRKTAEALRENRPSAVYTPSNRRCSSCGELGHNVKTCPKELARTQPTPPELTGHDDETGSF